MTTVPRRTTTPRGFAIYDQFSCPRGGEIRVQESSSAPNAAAWIFANNAAVHLTISQAKRARDALDAFIEENSEPQGEVSQ